jgi:hypothetical protein
MELHKIQQEQADRLRQESILNAFSSKRPIKQKAKRTKPKSRDLMAEAEYEIAHGSKSSRKTPNMESQ